MRDGSRRRKRGKPKAEPVHSRPSPSWDIVTSFIPSAVALRRCPSPLHFAVAVTVPSSWIPRESQQVKQVFLLVVVFAVFLSLFVCLGFYLYYLHSICFFFFLFLLWLFLSRLQRVDPKGLKESIRPSCHPCIYFSINPTTITTNFNCDAFGTHHIRVSYAHRILSIHAPKISSTNPMRTCVPELNTFRSREWPSNNDKVFPPKFPDSAFLEWIIYSRTHEPHEVSHLSSLAENIEAVLVGFLHHFLADSILRKWLSARWLEEESIPH